MVAFRVKLTLATINLDVAESSRHCVVGQVFGLDMNIFLLSCSWHEQTIYRASDVKLFLFGPLVTRSGHLHAGAESEGGAFFFAITNRGMHCYVWCILLGCTGSALAAQSTLKVAACNPGLTPFVNINNSVASGYDIGMRFIW